MLVGDRPKIRCYVTIPFKDEFHPLRDAIKSRSHRRTFQG